MVVDLHNGILLTYHSSISESPLQKALYFGNERRNITGQFVDYNACQKLVLLHQQYMLDYEE